jgi:hypothetical protein
MLLMLCFAKARFYEAAGLLWPNAVFDCKDSDRGKKQNRLPYFAERGHQ